jgi:NAD(P)-dependent dehydrogenase (short-subunit alcohol dehydrogenase family)
VQGTFSVARAFLPSVDSVQATFLGITTDVSLLPVSYLPGLSSYAASKLAQAKVFEFIAAEHPNVFVATMNPGMIDTDNFHRTGGKAEALPMDTGQITFITALHFTVLFYSNQGLQMLTE